MSDDDRSIHTSTTNEYELLTTKRKERNGTIETAAVQHVRVSRTQVCLSLAFRTELEPLGRELPGSFVDSPRG